MTRGEPLRVALDAGDPERHRRLARLLTADEHVVLTDVAPYTLGIEVELALEPRLARLHHVRAALLGGVQIPFYGWPAPPFAAADSMLVQLR